MFNKSIKKIVAGMAIGLMLFTNISFATTDDYGASGAKNKESYTLEEMLDYAIQDEYLAKSEYEKIMEIYGEQRPFSNIMKAEEQHISLLKPLFESYDLEMPKDTSKDHLIIPESLDEIFKIGVVAEVENIAMYEKFLSQDNLPEDVKDVFEALKNASENHLKAFERNSENSNSGRGFGRRR